MDILLLTDYGPVATVDGIALALPSVIAVTSHPRADDHPGRRAGALRPTGGAYDPSPEPEPKDEDFTVVYV